MNSQLWRNSPSVLWCPCFQLLALVSLLDSIAVYIMYYTSRSSSAACKLEHSKPLWHHMLTTKIDCYNSGWGGGGGSWFSERFNLVEIPVRECITTNIAQQLKHFHTQIILANGGQWPLSPAVFWSAMTFK